MDELKELSLAYAKLIKNYEKLESNNIKDALLSALSSISGPLSNLIEIEKFHKRISEKEYDELKNILSKDIEKIKNGKVNYENWWNW